MAADDRGGTPGFVPKLDFVLDATVLLGALALSLPHQDSWQTQAHRLAPIGMVGMLVWTLTAVALRHYDPRARRSRFDDAAMVLVLAMAVATVLRVLGLMLRIDAFLLAFLPVDVALRWTMSSYFKTRLGPSEDGVLVVGTGPLARATAEDLARGRDRHSVIGILELPRDSSPALALPAGQDATSELSRYLAAAPIGEVYIAGDPAHDSAAMQRVIDTCETAGVPFALPAATFRFARAHPVDGHALLHGYVHYCGYAPKPTQMAIKRLIDIIASAAAIWLLLPFCAVIALLIRLGSRGPIFFRQVRVGLHGRTFNMLKFRSMVVGAEAQRGALQSLNEQSGPVFKIARDPRVTRIGRFMRKFSIDELPQLINVLRGDMSVVGPRPPVPQEVLQYQPWQRRRLSVRPGLTCIWQVSGRNEITFDEWMRLDMRYIDHWSLKDDVGLILRTVPVVLGGRGAS
jgi:exopolysaccharide biosynthesis polyprenyl glycosylphosphotransferase